VLEGLELGEDLAFVGEAAQLALGEEELLAVTHFEDASAPGDQAHVRHPTGEGVLDLGRQTGGALVIASRGAVLDAEVEWLSHRSAGLLFPALLCKSGAAGRPGAPSPGYYRRRGTIRGKSSDKMGRRPGARL
jgi:hypothetical protein